jgi:plastocyanin
MIRSILIACAVVAFAGCGGDDDGDNGGTPDAAGAQDVEIIALANCPSSIAEEIGTMQATAFTNGTVTISVGEVIKFTPTGGHDMSSTGSVAWDTGALGTGACVKFNKAGAYPYKCSAHAAMTGTITVQ